MFLNPHWTDVTEGAERAGWKELAGASFSFFFFYCCSNSKRNISFQNPIHLDSWRFVHLVALRAGIVGSMVMLFGLSWPPQKNLCSYLNIFLKDREVVPQKYLERTWLYGITRWRSEKPRCRGSLLFRFLPSTGVYEIMLVNDNGGSVQCQ